MKPLTQTTNAAKATSRINRPGIAGAGPAPRIDGRVIAGPWGAKPEVLLSVHDTFEALRGAWTVLERDADCTAFQTYAWLSTWFRNIGVREGIEPAIVVGWNAEGEGKALFILPLGLKHGVFGTRLVWLGGTFCDYQAPLLDRNFFRHVRRDQFKALWAEIRSALPEHDIVELNRLPEMVGGQSNPFLGLGNLTAHASGAHMTQLLPTWDAYYGEKRSSGSKKRDRQKRRKLEEAGAVELVTPESREEIVRTVDELIAQKAATFARMGVANPFEKPGVRDFYMELATDAAARGLVHVCRLEVGGKIAAANWGVSFGGRYHYVLASYAEQEEFARRGPGMIQLMELMRHATETGHTEFDFTIGDEAYKADWCEVETRLYDHVEAVTVRGWLSLLPAIAFRRAKRFIKQTPVLWDAFTRLRAAAGPLSRLGTIQA
ncbi:GNAT family N-acetyltransferase [Parvibaculum sp.]|uniref:GNAT family N-acetyltransferase n=1 Tax=Parvibaculum sp. TaxID=2024848 RepID=UPI002BE266FC|nr:GNAT family N-acetyltransferase [Parvibaculum sp.]HUD53186.1 GNAT family N-acetyltransferase [Parvibaculum sp.]